MFFIEFANQLDFGNNYRVNICLENLACIKECLIHNVSPKAIISLNFPNAHKQFILSSMATYVQVFRVEMILGQLSSFDCFDRSLTYIVIITRYNVNVSTRKTGFPVSISVANRKQGK